MIEFNVPLRLLKNMSLFEETEELQINMCHHDIRFDIINGGHIMFAFIEYSIENDVGEEKIFWVTSNDFAKFLKLSKDAAKISIQYDQHKRKMSLKVKGKKFSLNEITPRDKFTKCENAAGEIVDTRTKTLKENIEEIKFPVKIECESLKWFNKLIAEVNYFDGAITFESGNKVTAVSTIGSFECDLKEAYNEIKIEGDVESNNTTYANQFLETISKIDMDHYTIQYGDMVPINFNMESDDGVKIWVALAPRVLEENIGGV